MIRFIIEGRRTSLGGLASLRRQDKRRQKVSPGKRKSEEREKHHKYGEKENSSKLRREEGKRLLMRRSNQAPKGRLIAENIANRHEPELLEKKKWTGYTTIVGGNGDGKKR